MRRNDVGGPEKNGLRQSLMKIGMIKSGEPEPISPLPASPNHSMSGSDVGFLSKSFDFASNSTMPVGSMLSSFNSSTVTKKLTSSYIEKPMFATIDPVKARERRKKGLKI